MTTPRPAGSALDLSILAVAFSLRREQLCVLLAETRPAGGRGIPACAPCAGRSLEDSARERIHSLSGVRETYQEQLYTYSEPGAGGAPDRVRVVYYALLPAAAAPLNRSMDMDAERADWFPVGELPALGADQGEILAYALRRLRYKLEYSAVGFQLLPEVFTLTQLQTTYEIILGETLDKRNFRRRILEAGVIEPTAAVRGGEGRPARLYHYRADAVAEVKTRRLFP